MGYSKEAALKAMGGKGGGSGELITFKAPENHGAT